MIFPNIDFAVQYVNPIFMGRLTFRDRELERSYCMQNDYMYKSSLFCITGQLKYHM